ncbi:MAG: hypothetical protein Q8P67_23335 [archaeon]|nr:hypothetical protein [archaeon]
MKASEHWLGREPSRLPSTAPPSRLLLRRSLLCGDLRRTQQNMLSQL